MHVNIPQYSPWKGTTDPSSEVMLVEKGWSYENKILSSPGITN